MADFVNSNRRDIRGKDKIINEHIRNNYKSESERKKKINKLQSDFSDVQAVDKDWGWLDPNDSRFISWTWYVLKNEMPDSNHIDDIEHTTNRNRVLRNRDLAKKLSELNPKALSLSSRRIEDKYNMLVELFSKGEASFENQLYIIKKICSLWERVVDDERIIKFLGEKPSEKSTLAYDKIKGLSEERWLFREKPKSDTEKYWSTITSFDLIDDKFKKEFLLLKIKRAWSQKKYKNKENAKKSYSISMTPHTKKKLDQIADFVDGKICDAIARIIDEEFERQKDKIKSD
ncbi:hypothetical protein A1OQ_11660 [Enterovibrio norvegicus FF-162]|uniref:hypothetical protein n=1 Tax=Enterovibrio norvegicus TaxID=188144 RepID=UPI00035E2718|nr:hypothetical protein [Enterovibrio norvegicus]OEE89427.1 hypothetical protein A1OQ_11660 [Enterovibrio norvegicus FF-162]